MIRIILVLLVSAITVLSQSIEEYIIQGKEKIESAHLHWDKNGMLEARAFFERILSKTDKVWLVNYYIAYCDYRLTTYAFGENNKKEAKKYVNDGIKRLKISIEAKSNFADAYALLSSFYGNKIALNPWSGFWYGPKSGKMIEKAFALEPNNPRLHIISGISAYYTPETWGGSKEKSRETFNKAAELFKNENVEAILPDWGYSEVYGWLGLVELNLGDTSSAKVHFKRALEINPENGWVKYNLLPQVEKSE